MMRFITLALICLLTYSCIPLQIAPQIKDHKITKGKKFKRKLPKQQVFIFEDPKNASEFYFYINTKFQLADIDVESNIPIVIDNRTYFLSFYEVEKKTKAINLVPSLINSAIPSLDEEVDIIVRIGEWYIALMVNDVGLNDALDESHRERDKVIRYLSSLKNEYLHSSNYYDAYFKTPTNTN